MTLWNTDQVEPQEPRDDLEIEAQPQAVEPRADAADIRAAAAAKGDHQGLPPALIRAATVESTDQAEGMMPVSERVRPEPRWPGIHHRSRRSLTSSRSSISECRLPLT